MLTVSIVTPSYNYAHYLSNAIDSVLSQDYPHIEYIVIDGDSNDSTIKILRGYGDRIRWISEPDRGQSNAINKGLALTSGEIVGWLNADDQLEPHAISRIVDTFKQHPTVDLIYGDVNVINENGDFVSTYPFIQPCDFQMLRDIGDFIVQPGAYWRRSAVERIPILREDLNWTMDYDLWLYLSQKRKPFYLPYPIASQREHTDTKTSQGGLARFEEIQAVVRNYGRHTLPSGFQDELSLWKFTLAVSDPSLPDVLNTFSAHELEVLALRYLNREPQNLHKVIQLLDERETQYDRANISTHAASVQLSKSGNISEMLNKYNLDEPYIQRLAAFERAKFALIHEKQNRKALKELTKAHLWSQPYWWLFLCATLTGGTWFRHFATRGRTAIKNHPLAKWFIKREQ